MAKEKSSTKNDVKPKSVEDEHNELDAAMSELSRQTDALLAETKPKKSTKPTLPKKKSASKKVVPHRNGQHLDIVGSGMRSGQDKLPAHATSSYNEKSTSTEAVSEEKKQPIEAHSPQIIRPHEGRTRAGVSHEKPGKTEEAEESETADASAPSPEKPSEHMRVQVDESEEQIAVHSEKTVVPESEKVHPDTTEEKVKAEPKEPDAPSAQANKREHTKQENTAKTVLKMDDDQDEDDGIVKMDDKADKKEEREKPTMYDTTEYQAELHDWSKLSKNSHWSFILLVLLLAVVGGLMYLYFTGNLPEIL